MADIGSVNVKAFKWTLAVMPTLIATLTAVYAFAVVANTLEKHEELAAHQVAGERIGNLEARQKGTEQDLKALDAQIQLLRREQQRGFDKLEEQIDRLMIQRYQPSRDNE